MNICGGEIPIFFMSVIDPIYSKIVPDQDSVSPEYLATGTSNTIPADLMIETANDITQANALNSDDYAYVCVALDSSLPKRQDSWPKGTRTYRCRFLR